MSTRSHPGAGRRCIRRATRATRAPSSSCLDKGADTKVTTQAGETPRAVAKGRGHTACVKLLDDHHTAANGSPSKKGKGKSKAASSAAGAPAPKSQKVSQKKGVAQVKFDASGAAATGKQVVKGQAAPPCARHGASAQNAEP
jgi:hypothetical protein